MGTALNNGALFFATDLAGALTGLLSLAVVIGGVVLVTGMGGRGVQEFLRHWLWQAVVGVIFLGSFTAIAGDVSGHFK
jgi:uncharacterized membrane protein